MLHVHWQNASLVVRRLVFRRADWPTVGSPVHLLADRAGLLTADESAAPSPGDFWLGCQPLSGWGARPESVAWACAVEVPLALALLRVAADLERADPGDREAPAPSVVSYRTLAWN
ncbi:hypothetical protein [Frigoriglobus tundricola]|uniref:Uncharacterized protein n=1 Tax=Frigoriglobus tundricola TaxID=2774151 RepID=A0A6M5Z508_9BACT|nr:hypothetical protein [Frigoriglobus tundricola]QJX01146.1 hypothetical protein FTUN_8785 [Frigoriglobus tundricola]